MYCKSWGGWECVEMVRKYAHFSSAHMAEYVDRLSVLQTVENGEMLRLGYMPQIEKGLAYANPLI